MRKLKAYIKNGFTELLIKVGIIKVYQVEIYRINPEVVAGKI